MIDTCLNSMIRVSLSLYFNFILSTFYFVNFSGILPLFIFFTVAWRFFISNNFFFYRVKPLSTDVINKTTPFKKLNYAIFVKQNLAFIVCLLIISWTTLLESTHFLWNHMVFNNFKNWMFFFLIVISFILYIYIYIISKNDLPQNIDFFFALSNLTAFTPILFSTNTLYTFLFLIEIISILLFYKFTVSKVWHQMNKVSNFSKKNKFLKIMPRQYISVLFFQFWSTFFSTVLILMTVLNLFGIFGTTEWLFMDVLYSSSQNHLFFENTSLFIFILFPFIIGLFLKLGMTPLHLYKIEVYRGLPFITIFFYTTYFFFSFANFFSYILMFMLGFFASIWTFFLSFFFLIGAVFLVCLLFDATFIKAFFAYSTIINILLILLLVVIYFN